MSRHLGERASPKAGVKGAWAILPTGACEVHGPHLPLDLDVRIAVGMAERAARRLEGIGLHAVVLPPLTYGVTRFGRNFPGTISIPPECVVGVVGDVLGGALDGGAAGLAVANAHLEPAQVEALYAACNRVKERRGVTVAFPHVGSRRHAERIGRIAPMDGHAGRYETSLALALAPELVGDHRALPDVPASLASGLAQGVTTFEEAGGPEAYFGSPSKATAREGHALLEELGAILVEAILAGRPGGR